VGPAARAGATEEAAQELDRQVHKACIRTHPSQPRVCGFLSSSLQLTLRLDNNSFNSYFSNFKQDNNYGNRERFCPDVDGMISHWGVMRQHWCGAARLLLLLILQ